LAACGNRRKSAAEKIVKTWLVAVLTGAAAHAGDWQGTLSSPQPGRFPPPAPLHAHYKFGWTSFSAAEGNVDFTKAKSGELRLDVEVKTIGFVRTLWRMDARHAAVAQAVTLRPMTVRQVEAYANETLTTTVDFDSDGVTRLRETKPADPQPAKPKRFKFAGVFDLHTALLWVRSQRLNQGDVYRLVVYPTTAPYLAEVSVGGREKLRVAGDAYKAVRLELKLRRIDAKTLELAPHKKFKRAIAWLSDDDRRLFLKAEANIFVGAVWMELERVEFY
jgi:hypothetical protein